MQEPPVTHGATKPAEKPVRASSAVLKERVIQAAAAGIGRAALAAAVPLALPAVNGVLDPTASKKRKAVEARLCANGGGREVGAMATASPSPRCPLSVRRHRLTIPLPRLAAAAILAPPVCARRVVCLG